jgi:hypothetical protein
MRNFILPGAAIAAAALLTACATPVPEHVALDPAARAAIDSTEVVAPVKQSEIYVFVPRSRVGAATGGGLIGALIDAGVDAHRAHTATDSVKLLRDATVDYNFDQKLTADLQQSLGQVPWLKVGGVRVMKDIAPDNLTTAIKDSKQSAVLFVGGDYQLSNDGSTLTVTLMAHMFANSDALRKFRPTKTANERYLFHPGNAIYRAKFVQTAGTSGTGHDRDANIQLWAANNGKPLRDALDKAVDDLTRQLTEDIQSDSSAPWQAKSGK